MAIGNLYIAKKNLDPAYVFAPKHRKCYFPFVWTNNLLLLVALSAFRAVIGLYHDICGNRPLAAPGDKNK